MKSPKSYPKSYKRIVELPQTGSGAKWTREGGAGWYVVQEREQDDSADLVRTPLAGPFRTRTEAEAIGWDGLKAWTEDRCHQTADDPLLPEVRWRAASEV